MLSRLLVTRGWQLLPPQPQAESRPSLRLRRDAADRLMFSYRLHSMAKIWLNSGLTRYHQLHCLPIQASSKEEGKAKA